MKVNIKKEFNRRQNMLTHELSEESKKKISSIKMEKRKEN